MKGKIVLLAGALLVGLVVNAQRASLNTELAKTIYADPSFTENISLLVKGDPATVQLFVNTNSGVYKFQSGDISSIILPANKITALLELEGIIRVEGLMGSGEILDEMSDLHTNMAPVRLGLPPLMQSYDGTGVVIGYIDSGIDITHPDFKNANGTTRIEYIWNQRDISGINIPDGFSYGREWTAAEINSASCTYTENTGPCAGYIGHGTNVAGLGSGNGSAVSNYYGMAPNSTIISVDIDVCSSTDFLSDVADAAAYIFARADSLGMPCIVNASVGIYMGSHDGTDLAAQFIDNLLDEHAGRAFVCAAGNAGEFSFHLGYEATPDTLFTWFKKIYSTIWLEFWADSSDWLGLQFGIGTDQRQPYQHLGHTPFYSIDSFPDINSGFDTLQRDLYDSGSNLLGNITIYMAKNGTVYQTSIVISSVNPGHRWRLSTSGSGRFDLWDTSGQMIANSDSLPTSGAFPITNYRFPDNTQTIVSSWACSDHVLATGNFVNRNEYIAISGPVFNSTDTVGMISRSSSRGPTRDERIKPDASAPAATTMTTGNLSVMTNLMLSFTNYFKIAPGGMHHRQGGTSMASPIVAGISALYLQQNPTATWQEVKCAVTATAYEDDLSGYSLPDNTWGHGKVDAFGVLTAIIVSGCTDPFSINFNPLANCNDGSCLPILFGCTDSTALNYDPNANMNDGSCQYQLGISATNTADYYLASYPNPAYGFTSFYYDLNQSTSGWVIVSDLFGRTMARIFVSDSKGRVNTTLQPGVYFYHLEVNDQTTASKKLMVF